MKSCPRKYKFKYVDGLEPKKKSSNLIRGKVVHEAFEKYFLGEGEAAILQFVHDSFNQALKGVSAEEEEEMILAKYTSLGMVENYPWKEVEEFERVIPEKDFLVPVPHMRETVFVGKADGLVLKKGLWWIREVKTTGDTPMQAEKKANVSYQASGYVYGITKAWIEVQGLLYDFIFKSRLRKRVSDTATSFGERILEDYRANMKDPETGKELKKSRMYHRFYAYRSASHLVEFVKDLERIARRIREAKNKNDFVRNTDSCYAFNKECPYMKICFLPKVDEEMLRVYYDRRKDDGSATAEGYGGYDVARGKAF